MRVPNGATGTYCQIDRGAGEGASYALDMAGASTGSLEGGLTLIPEYRCECEPYDSYTYEAVEVHASWVYLPPLLPNNTTAIRQQHCPLHNEEVCNGKGSCSLKSHFNKAKKCHA